VSHANGAVRRDHAERPTSDATLDDNAKNQVRQKTEAAVELDVKRITWSCAARRTEALAVRFRHAQQALAVVYAVN